MESFPGLRAAGGVTLTALRAIQFGGSFATANLHFHSLTSEPSRLATCEAPTFYCQFDVDQGVFWIRTYRASMRSRDEHWYGPFALK